MLNFIAIDFETANANRASACAVGAAFVQNGKISKTFYSLIKPHSACAWFDGFNTQVHGITKHDVEGTPEFPQIWAQLFPDLHGQTLIAHNASFDCGVLEDALSLYGLPVPENYFACSLKVSKAIWPTLPSHKLNIVADHIGYKFKHHNAMEDAQATAMTILEAARESQSSSLDELLHTCSVSLMPLESVSVEIMPPSKASFKKSSGKASHPLIDLDDPTLNPADYPLYGLNVAFTGDLESMSRDSAFDRVVLAGGCPKTGISLKTDYLVVAYLDPDSVASEDGKSGKLLKAEKIIADGGDLQIINEAQFLDILEGRAKAKAPNPRKASKKTKRVKEKLPCAEIDIDEAPQQILEIVRQITKDRIDSQRLSLYTRQGLRIVQDNRPSDYLCRLYISKQKIQVAFEPGGEKVTLKNIEDIRNYTNMLRVWDIPSPNEPETPEGKPAAAEELFTEVCEAASAPSSSVPVTTPQKTFWRRIMEKIMGLFS